MTFWEFRLREKIEREPSSDNIGVFAFAAPRWLPGTLVERCDALGFGPIAPTSISDERQATLFGTDVITDVKQVSRYQIIFDVPPDGYILYLHLSHLDAMRTPDPVSEQALLDLDPPCAARTFGELLRLMLDYEQTTQWPWQSREVVAVTARNILIRLRSDFGLTTQMADQVRACVPPTSVGVRELLQLPNPEWRDPTTAPLIVDWMRDLSEQLENKALIV